MTVVMGRNIVFNYNDHGNEHGIDNGNCILQIWEAGARGGGYSRQFRIGVCPQISQTLTLFKGRKSRIDTLLKGQVVVQF